MIVPLDPRYRHISVMLQEVYERYRRPIFVAETGIEDETRPAWLRYMSREVFAAWAEGARIEGLCLFPIVNHPGWEDDRHCYNGLFDYADDRGVRDLYPPLADELARQQENVKALRAGASSVVARRPSTRRRRSGGNVMDERFEESRATHDHVMGRLCAANDATLTDGRRRVS
jgi:hypothetical protein